MGAKQVLRLTVQNAEETLRVAADFASRLKAGDAVLLYGELGSGKTVFCKGIAGGLGVTDTVVSPTFTVLRAYGGRDVTVYHFDMYRIEGDEALVEAGYFDALSDPKGVVLAEWPERIPDAYLPQGAYTVRIARTGQHPDGRHVTIRLVTKPLT